MGTSKQEIQEWLDEGKSKNATHMLVVCDTYDWEDYPVYISPTEDVHKKFKEYSRNMQKVMEVYNLQKDVKEQLDQFRSFNY